MIRFTLRRVLAALALAFLVAVLAPAAAQARVPRKLSASGEADLSAVSIVVALLRGLLVTATGAVGLDIDPDGATTSGEVGPDIDPNGATTSGDVGSDIDPDGRQ